MDMCCQQGRWKLLILRPGAMMMMLNLGFPIAASVCFTHPNNASGVSCPFWGSPVKKDINTVFSSRLPRWLGNGSIWRMGRGCKNGVCSALRWERMGRSDCSLQWEGVEKMEPDFSWRCAGAGEEATGTRWNVRNSDAGWEKLLYPKCHQRLKWCPEKLGKLPSWRYSELS